MLSSIHPLGERARSNRWSVTVSAFALGASIAGALLGLTASMLGAVTGLSATSPVIPVVVIALAATADLTGRTVPTVHRQVNERWIGTYRGWVYGAGFGAQLGIGVATYIVTWAVPALVVTLAWIGDPWTGAAAGAVFGAGRTLPLLAAGWIDRPDRLSRFNRTLAGLARPANVAAALLLLTLAVAPGMIA